jgi:hypothetical protein
MHAPIATVLPSPLMPVATPKYALAVASGGFK